MSSATCCVVSQHLENSTAKHVVRSRPPLPRPVPTPTQALEEQNLFFIQNSQETEHALDELKQNFGKVQKTMDTKTQVGCEMGLTTKRTLSTPVTFAE